jgi:hypothetical protein
VAGSNCIVLETTDKTASVSTFSDTHEVLHDIPIVTAATAYDDPNTSTTNILILGQAIYMGDKMENSLICPNQLRTNGITVEDCPKYLAPPDKPSTHSIYLPDEDKYLPLTLQGITSSFMTRTPTVEEIKTCKWITLSNEYEWDPHSTHFQEQEDNYNRRTTIPYSRGIIAQGTDISTQPLRSPIKIKDTNVITPYASKYLLHLMTNISFLPQIPLNDHRIMQQNPWHSPGA